VLCRLDIFGQCYVGGCDLWSVLCRWMWYLVSVM